MAPPFTSVPLNRHRRWLLTCHWRPNISAWTCTSTLYCIILYVANLIVYCYSTLLYYILLVCTIQLPSTFPPPSIPIRFLSLNGRGRLAGDASGLVSSLYLLYKHNGLQRLGGASRAIPPSFTATCSRILWLNQSASSHSPPTSSIVEEISKRCTFGNVVLTALCTA